MVKSLGNYTLNLIRSAGDFAIFSSTAFTQAPRTRHLLRLLARAIYEQGVRCLPIILIVGAFAGLVIGLQFYYILSRLGSEGFLGSAVALTLIRELAPVLAALMIVGQAGSALSAELGIQRNSEQIDALETMGISPIGYLITPRILGAVITYPALTTFFALIGIIGGYVSGCVLLPLQGGVYWASIHKVVVMRDVNECLIKALVFGLITTAICCYNGYNSHRQQNASGARAVSQSTTKSVVLSSIAILAADYIITSFLV